MNNIEENPYLLMAVLGMPMLLAFSFMIEGFGKITKYDPSGWAKVVLGVMIMGLTIFVYYFAQLNPFW